MSSSAFTSPDANLLRGHLDLKVGSLSPAPYRLDKAGFVRSELTSGPRRGNQVKAHTLTESGGRGWAVRRAEFQTFTQQLGKLRTLTGGTR